MIDSLKKFKNKRVFITGNTGFKGSWLSYWLNLYGAKVYGFEDEIPSKPSFYEALSLKAEITQIWGDIRDFKSLSKAINNIKPDFIFHLAAQSLVAKSYEDPVLTFSTNFNGTLEATIFKRGGFYDFIGKVWYQQMDSSYKFGTQGGRLELSGNYFLQKYDSLSDQGVNMDSKYTRIWPKDIYTHNKNIKTVNNNTNKNSDINQNFYQLNWFNIDNPKNHWVEIPGSNSEINILESEIYLKGQKDINAFTQLLFKEPANENDMLIIDDSTYDYTIYVSYINDGYVSKDDWSPNSKELLAEMKKT